MSIAAEKNHTICVQHLDEICPNGFVCKGCLSLGQIERKIKQYKAKGRLFMSRYGLVKLSSCSHTQIYARQQLSPKRSGRFINLFNICYLIHQKLGKFHNVS